MRLLKIIFATFMSVLLITQLNYAQKLSVGIGGAYGLENSTVENGLGYQFSLIYKTQKRIAMFASISRYEVPSNDWKSVYQYSYSFDDLIFKNSSLFPGDFSLTSFELSPIVYLFEDSSSKISILAGAGFGLYYAKNKWNWDTYNSLLTSQVEDSLYYHEKKIGPNLGFNIRAGLNITATSNSYFNIEAKYVYYKPEIHYEISTPDLPDTYNGDRKINLTTLFISISLIIKL